MAATYTLIASTTVGTATTDVIFSSIPNTYTDLLLKASFRTNGASDSILITLNTSTSNFSNTILEGTGTTVVSSTNSTSGRYSGYSLNTTTNTFANFELYIPSYTASQNKPFSISTATEANATAAYFDAIAGLWSNTNAITEVKLSMAANFAINSSFFLYGIKNS